MTQGLDRGSNKVGLRINVNKTKIMQVGYATAGTPSTIGPHRIEGVQRFMYLGIITNDGDAEHNVAFQMGKEGAVFQQLQPIWMSTTISLVTKIHFFLLDRHPNSHICM